MHSAQRRIDDDVFELTQDELDDLPFGVITLDRRGRILRYNRAEATFSRRVEKATIGAYFFAEVAPCANVRNFRGRFDEFARSDDSGVERFDFSFAFRWGRQNVSITLLRKALHADINILVYAHATPPAGNLVSVDEGRPSVPSRRAQPDHALDSYGIALPSPQIYRLGDAAEIAHRSRIHIDDAVDARRVVAAAALGRVPYALEYRLMRPDNSIAVVAETGFFAAGPDCAGYATIVDVTARRRREEDNWRRAHYDALTGVPNQQLLLQRIADAVREAKDDGGLAAVLVLNIEKFRESNDMFGRDICNELLTQLALRLGESAREGDTVARLGGDWFAMLLTDIETRANVARVTNALVAAVARPFLVDGRAYHLTIRIGISIIPDDSCNADKVLRAAYTAMCHAKSDGSAAFRWYENAMSIDAAHRARQRAELRAAIDNDEFILHYQPIVDLARDRVIAVESLVRWNHPTKGLVPPAEFIGLADLTGLIVPLGERVLRAACRQGRQWSDLGFDLRICVNVSALQFRSPMFVELVATVLKESRLAPHLLELELTESVMVEGFGQMMETLTRLKALGLRLAVDDFGTGYSSLAYLKYFPIDTLKIDRAFVRDIAADEFDRAIAATVQRLANDLRLDCVAEGVETDEQVELLRAMGCTTMQGYYFARPLPADGLCAIVAASLGGGVVRLQSISDVENAVAVESVTVCGDVIEG